VSALAKINLGLKVLHKRADGYHELRTIFQTVSLADSLDIEFTPARRTVIEIAGTPEIPDNLAGRAARLVLQSLRSTGRVLVRLTKRIPVGAGLGGGSSDAAAVLLALPVLAGKQLPERLLIELAAGLGSDVPFFLLGGTAVAIGRGTELYPLPEPRGTRGLVIAPDLHVATPEAYGALARGLTTAAQENIISEFQSCVWHGGEGGWATPGTSGGNDFEAVVFRRHPRLRELKRRLTGMGASEAMLSGSGSALFGLFRSRPDMAQARRCFPGERIYPISFVSRARYRSLWWRRLRSHIAEKVWPPQSRYA
jgi:4-diphosphocytidyl-2-C-methyl-D-erythritol kinase